MTLTAAKVIELGYLEPRQLPTGEWAALAPMLFTTDIFIIVDEYSWRTRWSYAYMSDAARALRDWDGTGDPPGPWIKEKPSERWGPGAEKHVEDDSP